MKKLIFILFFTISAFIVNAQRYDTGITLQSLTDTLTRNQPVGTHITLLDSAEFYILNTSQVVGTSLATMIAAGEAVEFFNTTDVSTETIYTAAEVNAKIDSLATALGSSSGSGILGADSIKVVGIQLVAYKPDTTLFFTVDSILVDDGLGAELISNGTFDSSTWWNLEGASSISGGVANLDNNTPNVEMLWKDISIENDKTYRLSFDIVTVTSGEIYGSLGYYGASDETAILSSPGSYSYDLSFTGASQFRIFFYPSPDFVGTIDNVSVKEVL